MKDELAGAQGHTLVCTLEAGAAFGESILYDTPRNATVITSSIVMLLRVEQKDFKILWEVSSLSRPVHRQRVSTMNA